MMLFRMRPPKDPTKLKEWAEKMAKSLGIFGMAFRVCSTLGEFEHECIPEPGIFGKVEFYEHRTVFLRGDMAIALICSHAYNKISIDIDGENVYDLDIQLNQLHAFRYGKWCMQLAKFDKEADKKRREKAAKDYAKYFAPIQGE